MPIQSFEARGAGQAPQVPCCQDAHPPAQCFALLHAVRRQRLRTARLSSLSAALLALVLCNRHCSCMSLDCKLLEARAACRSFGPSPQQRPLQLLAKHWSAQWPAG